VVNVNEVPHIFEVQKGETGGKRGKPDLSG